MYLFYVFVAHNNKKRTSLMMMMMMIIVIIYGGGGNVEDKYHYKNSIQFNSIQFGSFFVFKRGKSTVKWPETIKQNTNNRGKYI